MRKLALFIVIPLTIAACSNNNNTEPRESPSSVGDPESESVDARTIFSQRCSACHGNEGRGDGPAAATLQPPPRNFHDAQWQASVTDRQISDAIRAGGAAVGKSPTMPAHPDLASQPSALGALVKLIRSFGRQP